MDQKDLYEEPSLEIISIDENVITTSPTTDVDFGEQDGW